MRPFNVSKQLSIICLLLLLSLFSIWTNSTSAQSIDELNDRLEDQKEKIEALNREIAEKQKELQQIGGEKSTLQAAVKQLELSRAKLQKDINKTEAQISQAETTLKKLGLEISTLEDKESNTKEAIGTSLRIMRAVEDESLFEIFLSKNSLSDFYLEAEENARLNKSLQNHLDEIRGIQTELGEKHVATEKEKEALLKLKKNLSGERLSVEATTKEKSTLLSVTANKEAEYQRILQEKIAQKAAFEKALFDIESQLKIALDPKSFSASKPGILSWPITNVRITQYFGATADAKRLYVSGTHNGVDFGVPDGTPILAALEGKVTAIGNTDVGSCYSYGKWILLEHANGLSTLYAHLSSFSVAEGDRVSTGDTIGYSGRTGYATGPHLHFTVYATQGIRVQQYSNSINCKNVVIPIADPKAYLDPMTYLPS